MYYIASKIAIGIVAFFGVLVFLAFGWIVLLALFVSSLFWSEKEDIGIIDD
jgi:hypothetical protein